MLYDVNYLITLPAINQLYGLISGGIADVSGTSGGSGGPHITPIPLSLEGVTVLYQAVCMLVVNAVNRPLCEQVRDGDTVYV